MRKLSELIVLVRGGGEFGSAIAHRLFRSHFRVVITETDNPLDIHRSVCYSEAIFDSPKIIEDVAAEKSSPTLEQIYKVWRNDHIPVVMDPDLSIKPLLKPDILINAMMLNRETSTKIEDAPLVIGIGPGFTVGIHSHMVIESNFNNDLGKVLIEGKCEAVSETKEDLPDPLKEIVIFSEDSGTFTSEKNIGDTVLADDIIGKLDDKPINAPISGILKGLMRNEIKVLANTSLIEIDPKNSKSVCLSMREQMRAVAGGALEAIMMGCNMEY